MPKLDQELSYFDEHRLEWLEAGREGQWAVVHGDTLLGFFPSFQEGFEAGIARFGFTDMLVKELHPTDRVERIPRAFWGENDRPRESRD